MPSSTKPATGDPKLRALKLRPDRVLDKDKVLEGVGIAQVAAQKKNTVEKPDGHNGRLNVKVRELEQEIGRLKANDESNASKLKGKDTKILGLEGRVRSMAQKIAKSEEKVKEATSTEAKLVLEKGRVKNLEAKFAKQVPVLEAENRLLKERLDAGLTTKSDRSEHDEVASIAVAKVADLQKRIKGLEEQLALQNADKAIREARDSQSSALEEQNELLRKKYNDVFNALRGFQKSGELKRVGLDKLELQKEFITAQSAPADMQGHHPVDKSSANMEIKLALSPVKSVEVEPSVAPQNTLARFSEPLEVTINVNTDDKKNLTLLQRVKSAVNSESTIRVRGPPHITNKLVLQMEDLAAGHYELLSRAQKQGRIIVDLQKENDLLQARGPCTLPAHRNLIDELEAANTKLSIQDTLLQQQGHHLRMAKELEEENARIRTEDAARARKKAEDKAQARKNAEVEAKAKADEAKALEVENWLNETY
ncbi:hypothetical protein BS50DRAFT_625043 [Corynespora cassiicola Philippines]|uniref:Uncharacterized protein n=1 Tax=Corynespora cassiicola Philippines TaxID=1448308 RepID=A0A2T2N8P8_CORCC|nr:hypothetical protein BS50DRAFT_625043 [Corynespora cassiicola Philippines]